MIFFFSFIFLGLSKALPHPLIIHFCPTQRRNRLSLEKKKEILRTTSSSTHIKLNELGQRINRIIFKSLFKKKRRRQKGKKQKKHRKRQKNDERNSKKIRNTQTHRVIKKTERSKRLPLERTTHRQPPTHQPQKGHPPLWQVPLCCCQAKCWNFIIYNTEAVWVPESVCVCEGSCFSWERQVCACACAWLIFLGCKVLSLFYHLTSTPK